MDRDPLIQDKDARGKRTNFGRYKVNFYVIYL